MIEQNLNITEIYSSVQGEAAYAGWPCTFVRLSGCPLRCRWCDTVYGFKQGETLSIGSVLEQVRKIGIPMVELTGGEPLAQKNAYVLLERLVHEGYKTMIETSGSEDIEPIHQAVHIIMDIKCPGSKMEEKNRWENLNYLKNTDEIKFVIADHSDFLWAKSLVQRERLNERFQVLFSAAFGLVTPKDLVEWILEAQLNVRLNLQQHKYIWHPRAKGV